MSSEYKTPEELEREMHAASEETSTESTQQETDSVPESNSDDSDDKQDVDVTALLKELEAAKEAASESKDQAVRAAAEMQNIRRRAQQDVEKAHKFALDKFVNDMLPVADNLERAVDAAKAEGADIEALVEGVELTLKTLIDGLKRHNVEQVDPEGQLFDPETQQAMTMVEDPNVEPNTVINVFQKGYTLSGRLVRPAMVVVSKG